MQTALADFIKDTPEGREADAILRACVHCGFCTATCPTYQLLGDELDGPRGRIYLIKQILEGSPTTARTQLHLDRCLTCRACETTCPSGVRYGRLADIGRHVVEQRVRRPWHERLTRWLLRRVLPYRSRFTPLLALGRVVRPLLPRTLRGTVPPAQAAGAWPAPRHQRRMLVLEGCVQPVLAPRINAATARVLDRLGISLVCADSAGCCGAVSHHLSAQEDALGFMRRNIDAWWPHVEAGVEALVMTASGCGVMVKEYEQLLSHDPRYAAKATRIADMTRDIAEVLADTELSVLQARPRKIAFQSPCTLQHGQKLGGIVEGLLQGLGFELTPVPDPHLCCGSAGTYSILQKPLSQRLLANKLEALESGQPELIATANIGCLVHLQSRAWPRVVHWIELLDKA
jgi:glycolate oxidase iron-sulfur subunit